MAKPLIGLCDLYDHQQNCIDQTATDKAVHQRIATDAQRAHVVLKECLREVLTIEGWDMGTLTMPASL